MSCGNRWRLLGGAVAIVVGLSGGAVVTELLPTPPVETAVASDPLPVLLASLPVRPEDPMTGYDRDKFGDGWADLDGDGCDTRDEILARDAIHVTLDADGCAGQVTVDDPFTGHPVTGRDRIDIDHVVALGAAWRTGAQALTPEQREALANDPDNLLAVDDGANQSKGDQDAAAWLPPDSSYACPYVAAQIEVKKRYQLWVTPDERAVMVEVLADCGGS